MSYTSFNPPVRTLMGPGPSDVHPRVLTAMARPTIGHLDPAFIAMMEEIKGLLQYAFQTNNALTIPLSAPGSAGMEACFVNLMEPGEKVVLCINGVFGTRMKENIERAGGVPIVVENAMGTAVNPNKLEDALKAHRDAKIVAFVHAETSTGVQSDAKTLAEIARRHDCLTIVDTVTSLGGSPLKVDEWGLDAVFSGSQKCLSCSPGLAPLTLNDRAVDKIKKRKTRIQSWFLDLKKKTRRNQNRLQCSLQPSLVGFARINNFQNQNRQSLQFLSSCRSPKGLACDRCKDFGRGACHLSGPFFR